MVDTIRRPAGTDAEPAPSPGPGTARESVAAPAELERSTEDRLLDLIDAGTTGVDVRRPTGSVGAAASLRLRGPISLDPEAFPIVYLDGARVAADDRASFGFFAGGQELSRLTDIPVGDLGRVTILRGPAATALYGTGASAGVVLLETRRGGGAGGPRWTARVEQGAAWDPTDWWSLAWNPIRSSVHVPGAKDTTYVQSLLEGTRYGSPFRVGHLQSWGASVRGGDEPSYYVSGERLDQEGDLSADRWERTHLRANAGLRTVPGLDLSLSTAYTAGRVRLPENDDNLYGVIGNALGSPWWGPMTRADPNRGGEPVETCFLAFEFARASGDPLAERSRACDPVNPFFLTTFGKIFTIRNEEEVRRFTGSAVATWRPSRRVTHRLTAGYDRTDAVQTEVVPVDPDRPFGADSEGRIDRAENDTRHLSLEASSTLAAPLSDALGSRTTLGLQWHEERRELDFAIGRRFPAGAPSLAASETVTDSVAASASARTVGLFLAERIDWRDRLFATAGLRLDDDSALGPDTDLVLFPSLQLSWGADREAWWPDLFERARLRAAWGRSGRRPDVDAAFDRLAPDPAGSPSSEPPPDLPDPAERGLVRETTTEWEAGLDLVLRGGRLGVGFTYYDRRAEHVLVPLDDTPELEIGAGPSVNAASIASHGIELSLDAGLVRSRGLRWDVRLALSTVSDEITDLPTTIRFYESAQQYREGYPVGSYFDRPVTLGPDGGATVGEESFLGTPTPRREGSLSSELRLFDRMTLFARADYAGGHVLHDLTEDYACRLMGGGRDEEGRLRGACPAIFAVDPATGTPTPEARVKIEAARAHSTAPYVHDAGYLRLRTLSFRFRIPERWIVAAGGWARAASVTVAGENLATWTAYPGTDPEVNESGSHPIFRQQFLGVPLDRRIVARLELAF